MKKAFAMIFLMSAVQTFAGNGEVGSVNNGSQSEGRVNRPSDRREGVIEKIYGTRRVDQANSSFLEGSNKRQELDGLKPLAISIKAKMDLGLWNGGLTEIKTPFSVNSNLYPVTYLATGMNGGKLRGQMLFFADSNNDVYVTSLGEIYGSGTLSIAKVGQLSADGTISLAQGNQLLKLSIDWMQCEAHEIKNGCVSKFTLNGSMAIPELEK